MSPDLLSPLDLDIPDFPSCNCEGPGGCQHLPPCVHGSTELLAVGAGGSGMLGVPPGLSVAGIHSKHSDLFPSYLLIQGHGNPTGRSGPDTPKTLIPGYSNGRGNLEGASKGMGVHSRTAPGPETGCRRWRRFGNFHGGQVSGGEARTWGGEALSLTAVWP